MNHDEVVRQKLTERYLLHELEDQSRDEFEEHFFQCSECALDLRTASEFVETSKIIFLQPSEERLPAGSKPRKHSRFSWLGWLQPQLAAAAMALLIAVVGYQNLVTLPRMARTIRQPQTLAWASLTTQTYGPGHALTVKSGEGFVLFVRTPADGGYVRYIADLYNPAGGLEYSLETPTASIEDQWPVFIPGANHEAGSYRIALRGVTASGETKDLGSAPFTLQVTK
jgi:Putative zinc-finger